MVLERMTGNGNGNKMNMRINILEAILNSETENSSDGSSARVNSLKQVIRRNKTDMASDAVSSLDLMRQIFQNEITREFHQVMDRYTRTTFLPAIENLKRNGHDVDEDVMNSLYVSMLEAAKKPFLKAPAPVSEFPAAPTLPGPSMTAPNDSINERDFDANFKRGYESDGSDVSAISTHSIEAKRRRGRPRKDEEAYRLEMAPPTMQDVRRWSPDRIHFGTKFVPALKVAALLNLPVSILFNKFPRMFKYSCDEDDKNQLADEKRVIRAPGRCYLVIADDAKNIIPPHTIGEVQMHAFSLNEPMLSKIRQKAAPMFEKLKACLPPQSYF
ncbi:unnamed protein product [Caenorhabditis auriculariae]|uniref:DNTTIP1 dimerisation domain-containing protein n=1 Tax=Caenorhabditis auriculariae TaxID=2777116 RepID=A0A8S1H429_9PELO|nr:unnamed protein product [Caenorhabditis auriculariae]